MEELKEIRDALKLLLIENNNLKFINYEKDITITNLMSQIEDLENNLNYAKDNGFIKTKKLVLPKVS